MIEPLSLRQSGPEVRPGAHRALLVTSIVVVAVMSAIPPRPGLCLTGPSRVAWGIVSAVAEATSGIWPSPPPLQVSFVMAAVTNVAIFVLTSLLWYRKAPRAFVPGMLIWLFVFLFWSVIFSPPTGCVSI